MRHSIAMVALAAMASIPVAASAMTVTYTVNMNGSKEVPANVSPAVGSGQFTIDDVAGTISFASASFALSGTPSGFHIHGPAPAGGIAGVVIDLAAIADVSGPVMFGSFAVPASYGAATTSPKLIGVPLATGINATPWLFYVNLHTTPLYGGGEIRSQLAPAPVPEPATFGMLALGLAGIGFAVRRRRG